jgi:two-component system sensor histidine kinase/response regulator
MDGVLPATDPNDEGARAPDVQTVVPELAADLERLRAATAADPALAASVERLAAVASGARADADATLRARAAFLAGMGHELRTPLNAILGFSQLLRQDRALGPEQQTHVEIIHRSGEHLLGLIRDVLDLARHGGEPRPRQAFDLQQLLDDLEDMLYLRAERRGLRVRLVRAPDLPRMVQADGTRLRQLLLHLLGNATQLAARGELYLHLACDREPTDPDRARLRCELVAPGQIDGLGGDAGVDSLAAELARVQGGRLWLEEGRLRVELPVGLAPSDPRARGPERRVVGLAPGQPAWKVLVAEDRWQSRQLLVQALARVGFEVREALDGEEALQMWEHWHPHLIWMDMRMPVMTGLEATQRIKASPGGQDTVIIALTASAFEEDPATARAAGCDDFVRKPIVLQEVFAKLAEHLGVEYSHDDPDPPPGAPPLPETALAGLPPAWLTAVYRASVQADLTELLGLLDEIRGTHPQLVAALTDLAQRFTYDPIIHLAQAALGETRATGGA